ncbi:MAG: sugar transferase [Sedimentisphaerales bacterium]|nr:sugar transferase [Sedimentisphaerales bacterium]
MGWLRDGLPMMNLVIFHNRDFAVSCERINLTEVLSCRPLAELVLRRHLAAFPDPHRMIVLLPDCLCAPLSAFCEASKDIEIRPAGREFRFSEDGSGNTAYGMISNGSCIAHPDWKKAMDCIRAVGTDVVAMVVDSSLSGYQEKVRVTADRQVVGFRRTYAESVMPTLFPEDWPDYVWLSDRAKSYFRSERLPLDFKTFHLLCRDGGLSCGALSFAGEKIRLTAEAELLNLFLSANPNFTMGRRIRISESARIIGPVMMQDRVKLEDRSVVIGPAILGEGVVVKEDALVEEAVIGPELSVPAHGRVRHAILFSEKDLERARKRSVTVIPKQTYPNRREHLVFRHWPWYSYACLGKRMFDVIGSLMILLLFFPVFPILAVVIKLTSPGPVFYRARRQGLHGRQFDCLKFRSMMVQADAMQEKLRVVNQVDGPQFKMENDPRVSPIGKFLRDTCLDEIPQFLNVLLGQMSIVGPRPSPETENSQCPVWRDARLSVRPGITGLWQLCRTRDPSRDFQEWVLYDTQYVRRLSFKTDLWIGCKTAQKLINGFIDQL